MLAYKAGTGRPSCTRLNRAVAFYDSLVPFRDDRLWQARFAAQSSSRLPKSFPLPSLHRAISFSNFVACIHRMEGPVMELD
jgi:hypothetical protein